ncbi:MAG: ribonuclease III [Planctomycetota bacterium]
MIFWKKDKASIIKDELRHAVKKCVGYRFSKKDLLYQALTHSSAKEEITVPQIVPSLPHINERLEFLGDAVLGLAISGILYTKFQQMDEGKMSIIKSNLVSRETLARKCHFIGLDKLIIVGRGIKGHSLPVSVLANAMEALFGAIFLEGGYDKASKIITQLFADDIAVSEDTAKYSNYKAILQDYSQQNFTRVPTYKLAKQFGPKHKPTFEMMVCVPNKSSADGPRLYGPGIGNDKKSAEQAAAKIALESLGLLQ